MVNPNFCRGKKVFITGHTGFKGSWLTLLLKEMGAEITGYSLPPPTNPSLFELANIRTGIHSVEGDIRDYSSLRNEILMRPIPSRRAKIFNNSKTKGKLYQPFLLKNKKKKTHPFSFLSQSLTSDAGW